MRKLATLTTLAAFIVLAGCVTINVYFPAAAAEQAAQKFIGQVMGDGSAPATASSAPAPASSAPPAASPGMAVLDFVIPAAHAQSPNLKVSSPEIVALRATMRARFDADLKPLLASGAVGFTADGMVALHDASKVPLAKRNAVRKTIADENRDRAAVYAAIAKANGHPEWEAKIRKTFAKVWVEHARSGWYYQNAAGAWVKK